MLLTIPLIFSQIEIPLSSENRYHSIFACLVSKEQSTESNPPMMMTCGHVISKDSLQKLNKSAGQVDIILCSFMVSHCLSLLAVVLNVHTAPWKLRSDRLYEYTSN